MQFIDSHAHLNFKDFDDDIDEVLATCRDAGVTRIVNIGTSLETSRESIALAERYPNTIYACVGIHPCSANEAPAGYLDELREMAKHPAVVGIGEIGLDYFHDTSFIDKQKTIFAEQMALASELDLPVVIHCREALDDTKILLQDFSPFAPSGVMHCFTGDGAYAAWLAERNFYVSFNGVATFPKAQSVRDAIASVPLERLMLETDCPFLAPKPKRGKRNDPSMIPVIAEKIAEIKGVSLSEVAAKTTARAETFYRLKKM